MKLISIALLAMITLSSCEMYCRYNLEFAGAMKESQEASKD